MNTNTIKRVLLSVSVVFSIGLFGAEPVNAYLLTVGTEKKIELQLDRMFARTVRCEIINQKGQLIFTEDIPTETFRRKRYDLRNLPDGSYSMVIHDLMKVERINFEIESTGIRISKGISDVIYKPTVWLNMDKSLDFNQLTLGADSEIRLFDGNELIYSYKSIGETSISKRLNLEQLDPGKYTMEIRTKGEVFYKYLNL